MKWPLTKSCGWTSSTFHDSELIAIPALQSLSMLIYLELLACWQSSAITGQAHRTSMSNQVKRAAKTPWVIKCVSFTVVGYWLFKRTGRWGVKYVTQGLQKNNKSQNADWKYHLLKWAAMIADVHLTVLRLTGVRISGEDELYPICMAHVRPSFMNSLSLL